MVTPNATQTAASKTGDVARKSPLEFFEHLARKVWTSDLPSHEKAQKMDAVANSIHSYLERAQVELSGQQGKRDAWTQFAYGRATSYLEGLASHVNLLANMCREGGAKPN